MTEIIEKQSIEQTGNKNKSKSLSKERTVDFKMERRGILLVCQSLMEITNSIEILEKNSARRYKLLKYIINNISRNSNYILINRGIEKFWYEFKDGKLFVNNKEVEDAKNNIKK